MSPRAAAPDEARVILYSRQDCHLCDEARPVVERVAAAAGASWREIDIDHPGPQDPSAAELRAEHGDYVPVVIVDGVPQGFWHIDEQRLARALTLVG